MSSNFSAFFHDAAVLNEPVSVRATRGVLRSIHVSNTNANAAYLNFYDALHTNVNPGDTPTPIWQLMIPGGSESAPGGCDTVPGDGYFNTALSIAATTSLSGNDAPLVGLNVNLTTARP